MDEEISRQSSLIGMSYEVSVNLLKIKAKIPFPATTFRNLVPEARSYLSRTLAVTPAHMYKDRSSFKGFNQ